MLLQYLLMRKINMSVQGCVEYIMEMRKDARILKGTERKNRQIELDTKLDDIRLAKAFDNEDYDFYGVNFTDRGGENPERTRVGIMGKNASEWRTWQER